MSYKDVIKTGPLELPIKHAEVLELLLQGVAVKDIACIVGYSEGHIYRIMSEDPIKSKLKKSKEVVVEDLSVLATERLKEMLCSDNLYAQQFAVSQWIKMQKDIVKVEIDGEKKFNSLEELMGSI